MFSEGVDLYQELDILYNLKTNQIKNGGGGVGKGVREGEADFNQ